MYQIHGQLPFLHQFKKKYSLDLVFENFRLVSNLSFVEKATEKAVVYGAPDGTKILSIEQSTCLQKSDF